MAEPRFLAKGNGYRGVVVVAMLKPVRQKWCYLWCYIFNREKLSPRGKRLSGFFSSPAQAPIIKKRVVLLLVIKKAPHCGAFFMGIHYVSRLLATATFRQGASRLVNIAHHFKRGTFEGVRPLSSHTSVDTFATVS